jgi:hypothetical protein
MKEEKYSIVDNHFEYDGKNYDCSYAIERDIKMILSEADESHKDSFDKLYDRQSLKADKVSIFLDEENKPVFGMVIYLINYKNENSQRFACGR